MNLNEDFINIQGIVLTIEKTAGPLQKIKYRGGNESTILNLIIELRKFFSSKKYITNDKINTDFDKELENICMFLILNTELKSAINEPELQHLMNIMPQLSTCLLSNLIVGLDISKFFCKALLKFDVKIAEEILSEIIPVLKKSKPKVQLLNAYEFLLFIINKVEDCDDCEHLNDIASQILLQLTAIHGEHIEKTKIDSVYECMGITLLKLLDLLLKSNYKLPSLEKIIERLIKTSCSILMAVTVDVFCYWAELEFDNEILQKVIAEKSYYFIEKYQKYSHAKELINMLGTIARKPKSINEQILASSVPTMIAMINKADENQKRWFTALLNTQVLKCPDSIKCIDKWAHLCTISDVSRLLTLSTDSKDTCARNIVIKCAASLYFNDLVLATTSHLHLRGINKNLNEDIQQQLILVFNKIKNKSIGDDFCKELYLLLLQNPQQMLAFTFNECFKNIFYTHSLTMFWDCVKQVVGIDNFGLIILKREMENNGLDEHNCKNYTTLFDVLIERGVFSVDVLTLSVVFPMIEEYYKKMDYQSVKFALEILKDLQTQVAFKNETCDFFNFLLEIMKSCRCNFLNFNGTKQEIVKSCVDIFEKILNDNTEFSKTIVKSEDFFVSFYQDKLLGSNSDFLSHFFPISFHRHAEVVAHLIKILPLCVTPEWLLISSKLISSNGVEKTIEFFCDCLILLCELVNSQETKTEEVKCMFLALAYCLQNLNIVIKDCIIPAVKNVNEDVTITKNVCRLLKEIPSGNLKSEEGISLAGLLSETSLKSLRTDKKFAVLVASINESNICKMLAQKILS